MSMAKFHVMVMYCPILASGLISRGPDPSRAITAGRVWATRDYERLGLITKVCRHLGGVLAGDYRTRHLSA